MTRWRQLLVAGAVLTSSTASAQDAAPASASPGTATRERISFVAFGPNRLGLLVPINQRWLLRPDVGGFSTWFSNGVYSWNGLAGLSLIRRTVPTDRGWVYAALRYGISLSERRGAPTFPADFAATQLLTATGGAHAQVRDWLGLFAEAGVGFEYFEEGAAGDKDVIVRLNTVSRLGITLQRSPTIGRFEPERVALVFGGHAPVGLLIPLSDRWLVRPDLRASFEQDAEYDYTYSSTTLGVSLVRRTAPTEDGWLYSALRHGATVVHEDGATPLWSHATSLTFGAHVRLIDRIDGFAESGFLVDQGPVALRPVVQDTRRSVRIIQRFGIALHRKSAAP